MNKQTVMAVAISAVLFAGVYAGIQNDVSNRISAEAEEAEKDQIIESFERELNREPGPARPAERTSIDEDVLYHTANSVHWTDEESAE